MTQPSAGADAEKQTLPPASEIGITAAPGSDNTSPQYPATEKHLSKQHHDPEIIDDLAIEQEAELGDLNNNATLAPIPSRASQLPLSKARTILLVLTVTGAAFLNTLSVQAVVIVLPTIGRDLSIPAARQQWIVSAYALAFGVFLLLWGRIADVYGKRLVFIYGSAWVCVVTLICPFIPNEIGFDVFRGLQGFGAAANVPTAIGILGVTFPPGKAKNYAFAAYSSGAPLGSVFGNILGGVMAQYANWKWIFWVLTFLALGVTGAGWFLIPLPTKQPTKDEVKNAIDWVGGAMVTVSLFVLLFALTEGNIVGWGQAYIIATIVLSLVLFAAFVAWEWYLESRTTRKPLLKISIFKNKRVAAAMFTMGSFNASFNQFLIFATYYYQDYKGFNPIQTTLRFLPTGIVGVTTVFVTSQLLARVRVNYIVMWGTLCCATSSLLFAVPIPPNTTYWAYGMPAMALSVMAADTIFPSLILFTAHNLPKEDQALGGALINAVAQVTRSVGLAIAVVIQVRVQQSHEAGGGAAASGGSNVGNAAYLDSLRAANWFNVGLAVAAFGVVAIGFRGAGVMGGKEK